MTSTPGDSTSAPIGLTATAHVGITVADLDRSIAFYRLLTGIDPSVGNERTEGPESPDQPGSPPARLRYAIFQLRDVRINLVEFDRPSADRAVVAGDRPGSMHLCFRVDNLDDVRERMTAAGIEFLGLPFRYVDADAPTGAPGTEVVYFDDPDGTTLELNAA
ncbi:VOC family protein [Micromonospora sp. NBC_01699]|uniref:VOC family protein n=1 Tax=Micromonospora sp. NBC_01699 TaxID=2975984 RepID=UPI002E2A350A|nr:VOC family protein [Micromonospora sp. NBC_01699]